MDNVTEIWSGELQMRVRITRLCSGALLARTEDGVTYLPSETRLAIRERSRFPPEVHAIKKAFGGTIVQIGDSRTDV